MEPYYKDESVELYCGDCRELLPVVARRCAACITDPPYGVNYKYTPSYSDNSGEDYAALISKFLGIVNDTCDISIITPGISNMWLYPAAKWVLCWNKPNSMRRNMLGGFNMWEPILFYGKKVIYQDSYTVAVVPSKGPEAQHPCPKPLKLLTWLVRISTKSGDTIVDPFAGSGTTLVAAKLMGRRAIGIEIDKSYCNIIVERLSQQVINFDAHDNKEVNQTNIQQELYATGETPLAGGTCSDEHVA